MLKRIQFRFFSFLFWVSPQDPVTILDIGVWSQKTSLEIVDLWT